MQPHILSHKGDPPVGAQQPGGNLGRIAFADVRGIEIPEYDLVEEDSDGESEENTESMEGEMDEE